MAISYKMLPNFLSAHICDKILENIPPPNYDTMRCIDRSVDLPPLNTWYRMEKVPFRIELDLSEEVRQKLHTYNILKDSKNQLKRLARAIGSNTVIFLRLISTNPAFFKSPKRRVIVTRVEPIASAMA